MLVNNVIDLPFIILYIATGALTLSLVQRRFSERVELGKLAEHVVTTRYNSVILGEVRGPMKKKLRTQK